MIMICTYFNILLFLSTLCDGLPSKRNFDPDSLMQSMMFGQHNAANSESNNNPSVFGSNWGLHIHNPSEYLGQYVAQSNAQSLNPFHQSQTDILTNSINTDQTNKNNDQFSNLRVGLQQGSNYGNLVPSAGNWNGNRFNPNVLNKQLMQMSGANSYDMLKGFKQANTNGKLHDTNGKQETVEKSKHNQDSSIQQKTEVGDHNTADDKHVSATKAGGNSKFNSQKMGNMVSFSNNGHSTNFQEHGTMNISDKTAQSKSSGHKYRFDATELNSKLFNNVGYNPVYVNRNKHKRDGGNFNPNTMMTKFMELRTNIDSFGSYHPLDLINKLNALAQESKNNDKPAEFDPNSQSMFQSIQHTDWGVSVYNPLQSLDQYSGSGTGIGTSGPSPKTASSAFNPNALNTHLMSILKEKMKDNSEAQGKLSGGEFNPSNLNENLFHGLKYNPTAVIMKTVLPMFRENIALPVVTNSGNNTRTEALPGLENTLGHGQKQNGAQNGYVKNTHSETNHNAVLNTYGGNIQQIMPSTTMAPNNGKGYITNNHEIQNNKNEQGTGLTNPNFNFGLNKQHTAGSYNIAVNSNAGIQTGASHTAQVQATGVGSFGGSVQTHGNGYHQATYQQGPSQGIVNNTSIFLGSGLSIQTQAGGLGSTSVQQNGLTNTNVHGTNAGTAGKTTINDNSGSKVISQTGVGSLGYTKVGQTGSGSLGSNTVQQTAAGGFGSTSLGHTGSGSMGSNTISQTAAGGLGSTSVGQTGSGTFGSNTIKQTNTGGLGSQTFNLAGSGSNTPSQISAGGLGSTSVAQTGSGTIGSKTILQTAVGGLGSTNVVQTGSGSLGSNTVTQNGAGGLGNTSVGQTNVGTLGTNNFAQINAGGIGSNTVTQTAAGSLGSNAVQQTNSGSLRSKQTVSTGANTGK